MKLLRKTFLSLILLAISFNPLVTPEAKGDALLLALVAFPVTVTCGFGLAFLVQNQIRNGGNSTGNHSEFFSMADAEKTDAFLKEVIEESKSKTNPEAFIEGALKAMPSKMQQYARQRFAEACKVQTGK